MHEGFRWLLGWFAILFIFWLALGGPNDGSRRNIFVNTGNSGSIYESENLDTNNDGIVDDKEVIAGEIRKIEREIKDIEKELEKLEEQANNSPYKEFVSLDKATATTDDPEREYLRIRIDRSLKKTLSTAGWYLESSMTGQRVSLPQVTKLPVSGRSGVQEILRVQAGDTLIINTGRSQIGHSFQLNSCTGYFEQFQNFNPTLPRQCPDVAEEPTVAYGPHGFGDACLDYLERWPRCTAHVDPPPVGMPYQCQQYIGTKINYNACVDFHKNDADFYKQEWRLYLNREDELWKAKRELITLRDANGKILDILSY